MSRTFEENAILSDIGNAFFSGLSFEELWFCIEESETREELSQSIEAVLSVKEFLHTIQKGEKNG